MKFSGAGSGFATLYRKGLSLMRPAGEAKTLSSPPPPDLSPPNTTSPAPPPAEERRCRRETDAVILVDAKTERILEVNAAAQNLLDGTLDELLQLTLRDFSVGAKPQPAEASPGSVRHRKLRNRHGRIFDAELRLGNLSGRNGGNVLVGTVRDVTLMAEAERKLLQERARLQSVFDAAASGIIMMNQNGIIESVNRTAEKIFGWTTAEMLGRNINLLMPEPDQATHDGYLARYLERGGEPAPNCNREVTGVRKDGTLFPLELATSVVRQEDGSILFTGIVNDITERREADRTVRSLSKAVMNSSAIVIITNAKGVIEFVNPRGCLASGYSPEELIGQTPRIFKSDETSGETYREMWRAISAGKVWRGEFHNRRKDGSHYWVKAVVDPIADEAGAVTHFVAVEEDITQLKAAKDEAERANLAKSDFLSAMSHELRTPLNVILGFSQVLQSSRTEKLSDRQRTQVAHIHQASTHLLQLISEILDMARIEAGHLTISPEAVDAEDTVTECVDHQQHMAKARGITIENRLRRDPPPFIFGDRGRFRQVMSNLLSNAIKYNVEGGRVIVEAEAGEKGRITFTVTDTGIGIPADRQTELFQPFNRLGAEARGIEGTGIGLVVTRRLVEAMGGTIGFTSGNGQGTVFRVTLPGAEPSLPASGISAEAAAGPCVPTGTVVIYVEDNPGNALLMEDVLASLEGVRLVVVPTAEMGLALAASDPAPALMILDLNLPGMGGIEAARRLKASPATRNIPLLAVSADAMPATVRKTQEAGFADFVAKPIDVAAFQAKLGQMLERPAP